MRPYTINAFYKNTKVVFHVKGFLSAVARRAVLLHNHYKSVEILAGRRRVM